MATGTTLCTCNFPIIRNTFFLMCYSNRQIAARCEQKTWIKLKLSILFVRIVLLTSCERFFPWTNFDKKAR